jgi:hypothetical protein
VVGYAQSFMFEEGIHLILTLLTMRYSVLDLSMKHSECQSVITAVEMLENRNSYGVKCL